LAIVVFIGMGSAVALLSLLEQKRHLVAAFAGLALFAAVALWWKVSRALAAAAAANARAEARVGHDAAVLRELLAGLRNGDVEGRALLPGGPLTGVAEGINALLDDLTQVASTFADTAEGIGRAGSEIERSTTMMATGSGRQAATMAEISRRLSALSARCEEIGQVVEVLDDLGRQTNVLALNAALEASRAGPHGRGFAMVAEEVRKLAERSTSATKDMAALVQAIEAQAVEAGRSIDEMTTTTRALAEGASETAGISSELCAQARGLHEVVARLRLEHRREGELRRLLGDRTDDLSRVLEPLLPLLDDRKSVLAQAVRNVLLATRNGARPARPAVDVTAAEDSDSGASTSAPASIAASSR
jgi:methyl-accepting chemotaxis protein